MVSKLVLIACLAVLIAFAQGGLIDTPSKIYKILPHETRVIPIWSRHVREADGWSVEPNIDRDANGNTAGSVKVQKDFGDHEVHAGASRVFSGPNRGAPSYNVGATFRW